MNFRTALLLILVFVHIGVYGSEYAPIGGPENGYRPMDIISPDGETFLGQAVVRFTRAFPDAYNKDYTPVSLGDYSLDALFAKYGVYYAVNLVPWETAPTKDNPIDLRWTFWLHFPLDVTVNDVVTELEKLPFVDFAEPNFVRYLDFIPNDALFSAQWHLTRIGAHRAWDYTLGSTEIVISIVDSGVDILHEDLIANRWVNPGEDLNGDGIIQPSEINGVDNDGNGKVDDFYGWDFTGNDNDPTDPYLWTTGGHGTHVAGCASAVLNNGMGVASPGGRSRIMSNRCGSANNPGTINGALGHSAWSYSRISGANIINNSWGGASYSQAEQNTITSCWNSGMLIFGSAGNENNNVPRYPSNYANSISVAATNQSDQKASFSSFGTWVEISSPGTTIWSTVNTTHNSYDNSDGTSMASPVAAGCAALLWSVMPGAMNSEVRNVLYETSTNINASNPNYQNQLGVGLINVGNAVESQFPLVQLVQTIIRDTIGNSNGDGRAVAGETAALRLTFTANSNRTDSYNTRVRLSTNDPYLIIQSDSLWIGDIISGASTTVTGLRIQVATNSPSHRATLNFTIRGTNPYDVSYSQTFTSTIMVGYPSVILIDDDGGVPYEQFYQTALDSVGEAWDYWNIATQGLPDVSDITRYSEFIWWTGDQTTNTLTSDEQLLIQWLLNNNKSVLLSGQNIGEEIGNSAFHQQVLRANSSAGSSSDRRANGIAGNALSEGINLFLSGSSGANNYTSPNILNPINGSQACWIYNNSQQPAAIYYTSGNRTRLVYCGFPVESIHNAPNYSTRAAFLQRVLSQFRGLDVNLSDQTVVPDDYRISAIYPNPFNSQTSIQFALPRSEQITISVYDVSGRMLQTITSQTFDAGNHTIHWTPNCLASGVYLVTLTTKSGIVRTSKTLFLK
ncbi:MAG: S8 family peptidase [bacterium]|nr:S8 family peptidase [bacterium]